MARRFDLIVFDWDGTLIDSVPRIVRCFEQAFQYFELDCAAHEMIRAQIGLPLTESFPNLVLPGSGVSLEQWVEAYRNAWYDEALNPISPLFEGVPALLHDLAKIYPLAIATGKSRLGLERELKRYELTHFFPHARCANETKPKPNSEMLNELMAIFQVTPQRTMMVGDTVLDLNMARNAGTTSVGVCTGTQSMDDLRRTEPTYLFEHVSQLRHILLPE